MPDAYPRSPASQTALDVEETGDVATGQDIGTGGFDRVELVAEDGRGDSRHLDGEQPSEPTALSVAWQFGTALLGDELVGLMIETQASQAMTGVMEGDGATGTVGGDPGIQVVDEELSQFPRPLGNAPGLILAICIGEQLRVMMDDHLRAGARGKNDRPFRGVQDIQGVGCHLDGRLEETDVEGRLAAARLTLRVLDITALTLQNCQGRSTHPG